jgi:hypothetical protein
MLLYHLGFAFVLAAQLKTCTDEDDGRLFVAQMDPIFIECAIKSTKEPDTSDCNTENPGYYIFKYI